jgi:hypothetical protein
LSASNSWRDLAGVYTHTSCHPSRRWGHR